MTDFSKTSKDDLITLIYRDSDIEALIAYLNKYRKEDEDIKFLLQAFSDLSLSIIRANPMYPNFYSEYVRLLRIALMHNIIAPTQKILDQIRSICEKALFYNPKKSSAPFTYTAQLYAYLYVNGIESTPKSKDYILYLFDQGIELGGIIAPEEKKRFLSDTEEFDINMVNANTDLGMLTTRLSKATIPFTMLIYGPPGTGKSYYLRHLARMMKIKTVEISPAELFSPKQGEPAKNVLTLFKNAERTRSMIIMDEVEKIVKERQDSKEGWRGDMTNAFLTCLESATVPFVGTTNFMSDIDKAVLRRLIFKVKFDYLTDEQLQYAFRTVFKIEPPDELFKIGGLTIGDFVLVKKKADILGLSDDVPSICQMLAEETNFKSAGHVERVDENMFFDPNFINMATTSLEIYIKKIKTKQIHNFSILLHGPSGTGKSLYLRNLARELDYEIIERRASDILSRWYGEAEKNLARAFEEAKDRRAMLIFDEIDSLLPTKERLIHLGADNRLISEFLVQLEHHNYPVCATTNYFDNLEKAAIRRFKVNEKFDYLRPEQYDYIYQKMFGFKPPKNIRFFKNLTPAMFASARDLILLEDAKDDEDRIFQIFTDEVSKKQL